MKNLIFTAVFSAIFPLLVLSCGKEEQNLNNPPVTDIPAQRFSIRICDEQPGISPDSIYRYYAVTDSDLPDGEACFTEGMSVGSEYKFGYDGDRVRLVQTPYNTISFEASADVNASSGSANLDIIKIDSRHYRVGKYIRDGSAEIRFWNGSGDGVNSISILVDARKTVPVEGFELRMSDRNGSVFKEMFLVPQPSSTNFRNINYNECKIADLDCICYPDWMERGEKDSRGTEDIFDLGKASILEFVGTVPRNATPDNEIVQMVDFVSHRQISENERTDYHPYNSVSFSGYRWTPYMNGFSAATSSPKEGQMKQSVYPADIRYLKAMVWSKGLNFKNPDCYAYIWYRAKVNGTIRNWWGVIYESHLLKE